MAETLSKNDHCLGCVYYPPNLPAHAYSHADHRMLQEKSCSFDFHPEDEGCRVTRKTSCSLVDLENLRQTI
jgi:hypothetical protein